MATDFPGAFAALRRILLTHAGGMIVLADEPADVTLASRAIGPNGKPLWFGAVYLKKSAVTYHLMPLYFNPRLNAAIAPELKARMQGKTCFNFQRPDAALFRHLDDLTRLGREAWERAGFLEPGTIPPERFAAAHQSAGGDAAALAATRQARGAAAAAKRAATIRKRAVATRAVATRPAAKRAAKRER